MSSAKIEEVKRGEKFFEWRNHLGNVLATVSDRKIAHSSNSSTIDYYEADLVSAQDYYPFGMIMHGRTVINGNGYRYGFQNQEKDNEIVGEGNSYAAQFWQYDSRLGRRWNVDPKPNPSISSYTAFANNPIFFADPLGDTVRVGASITGDKLLNASFNAYAGTKQGRKYLANYASKGQTINGYTFTKDGKYSKQGIDLNFDAQDISARGETGKSIDANGRAQINITINNKFTEKTVNGLVNEAMGKVVTFFHESFIHGDLSTKDYLDNKKFDYSNIGKEVKDATGNMYWHFHHYKVLMDFQKNGYNTTNMWPGSAFYGIQEINNRLKTFKSDQDIIIRMWDYSGGVKVDGQGNAH